LRKQIRNSVIITTSILIICGLIGLSRVGTLFSMLLFSDTEMTGLVKVVQAIPPEMTLYSTNVEVAYTKWKNDQGVWTTSDGWHCNTPEEQAKVDEYFRYIDINTNSQQTKENPW